MRIGIDLDNTLADYRCPLERLCVLHGLPGPHADPKLVLRGSLRKRGQESEWTRLQGELYGPLMNEAELFPGAADAIRRWQARGDDVCVVSHRTRYPIAGEKHDLHAFARDWIRRVELPVADLFLEESKEAKIERIESLQCDVFVDDLPEVLSHPRFRADARKILFDPGHSHRSPQGLESAATWSEIEVLINQ